MITMWHGCRLAAWEKCVEQGHLLHQGLGKDPLVYLATDLEEAMCHGEVVLEVQFHPEIDTPNNYHPGCWQCRVYKGIPLDRVRVLTKTNDRIGDCVRAFGGIRDPLAYYTDMVDLIRHQHAIITTSIEHLIENGLPITQDVSKIRELAGQLLSRIEIDDNFNQLSLLKDMNKDLQK